MENYVALLFLVVPGFIAHSVNEKLNDDQLVKDKFDLTIRALIYSIFIVLTNYVVLLFYYGNVDLLTLQHKFISISFIVKYMLLTVCTSISVGCAWNFIRRGFYLTMNSLRCYEKKNPLNERTVFSDIFDDGKEHIIEVQHNGIRAFGNFSSVGERGRKEIYVLGCHDYERYKNENPEQLNKVKGVYYDFDGGFSITEYINDVPISDSSEVE